MGEGRQVDNNAQQRAVASNKRVLRNRILIVLAVLAIAAGVLWGQALITWLNATLL